MRISDWSSDVCSSFGMVALLWLSRLLAGANFLHRLELAQAAACATIKPAAHIVEDGDDIHRAELRNARFIAEFSFGAEAGAAIGKGVPVYFAAVHVKIDCAIIAHFGVLDGRPIDAIDCFADRPEIV